MFLYDSMTRMTVIWRFFLEKINLKKKYKILVILVIFGSIRQNGVVKTMTYFVTRIWKIAEIEKYSCH